MERGGGGGEERERRRRRAEKIERIPCPLAIKRLSRLSNVQPVIGPRSESKLGGRCDLGDRGIRSLFYSC